MNYTEINKDEIERRKGRLLNEYDDVIIEDEVYEVEGDEFSDLVIYAEDGYFGGSAVWVVRQPEDAEPLTESMVGVGDETERVLMILPCGSNCWGLAGGGREPDESFEETAVREIREETGIECCVNDLIYLRLETTVSKGESDKRLHTMTTFFEGEYEGGDLSIQEGELNGAAWFDKLSENERMNPENQKIAEKLGW